MKKFILIVVMLFMLVGCKTDFDVRRINGTDVLVSEIKDTGSSDQVLADVSESPSSIPMDEEHKDIGGEGNGLQKVTKILDLIYVNYRGTRTSSTEYLEYGDKVEYCYLDPLQIIISMEDGQEKNVVWEDYILDLTPPQYRAFLKFVFDPYGVFPSKEANLTVEVDFLGDEIESVNRIFNSSGDVIWDKDMTIPPRELSALELAYLDSPLADYDLDFDLSHDCFWVFSRKGFGYVYPADYSPLELEVMDFAFAEYIRTNTDIVIVDKDFAGGPFVVTDGLGNNLQSNFAVTRDGQMGLIYYKTLNNTPLRVQNNGSLEDVLIVDPLKYWYADVYNSGVELASRECNVSHDDVPDCNLVTIVDSNRFHNNRMILIRMAPLLTEEEVLEYFEAALENILKQP